MSQSTLESPPLATPAQSLDYLTPTRPATSPALPHRLLLLSTALLLGLLSANSFADAVGLPAVDNIRRFSGAAVDPSVAVFLRVCSFIVVTVFAAILLSFISRALRLLATLLASTPHRPNTPAALTMIIAGVVAAIASLVIPIRSATPTTFTMTDPATGPAIHAVSTVPVFVQFLSLCLFLAAITLTAIGIWSTLRRPTPS